MHGASATSEWGIQSTGTITERSIMSKKNMRMIRNVLIALGIIALLFWNPVTRSIIILILPMGSGVDDAIFIAALIGFVAFGIWWLLNKRKER